MLQLFISAAIGITALSFWQAQVLISLSAQDLPGPELIKDIGLVGYLLLACVASLLVMGTYLVKKLVDALVGSLGNTANAVNEIVKAEANQRVLLEQIQSRLIDLRRET